MEIMQVAESEKFLNTMGKLRMWKFYKTKKTYMYITRTLITPLPLSPESTFFTVRHKQEQLHYTVDLSGNIRHVSWSSYRYIYIYIYILLLRWRAKQILL